VTCCIIIACIIICCIVISRTIDWQCHVRFGVCFGWPVPRNPKIFSAIVVIGTVGIWATCWTSLFWNSMPGAIIVFNFDVQKRPAVVTLRYNFDGCRPFCVWQIEADNLSSVGWLEQCSLSLPSTVYLQLIVVLVIRSYISRGSTGCLNLEGDRSLWVITRS
jgi:hypothetical protein